MKERRKNLRYCVYISAAAALCCIQIILLAYQIFSFSRNPISVADTDVEQIKLERDYWNGDGFDGVLCLAERSDIRRFCELWNSLRVTEIEPYVNSFGNPWVQTPAGESLYLRVEFHMRSGEIRTYSPMRDYIMAYPSEKAETPDQFYFYTGDTLTDCIKQWIAEATGTPAEVTP